MRTGPTTAGARSGAAKQLERATFRTSRLLDFCSRKELVAQTGHRPAAWPLVVLKELLDNALDACEDAARPPRVLVAANSDGITVSDNGTGIPPETVQGVLDFAVRVSSREAYVSPTRGAQGNALKTVVAMPFVLDGSEGYAEITARGVRHGITLKVDRIRQEPVIEHRQTRERAVKTGTTVRVAWPVSACSLDRVRDRFLQIAADYTVVNPHLTLTTDWFGETAQVKATDPRWRKWLPSNPTSAHWYGEEPFARLLAGYLTHDADHDRQRTVREFVAEFDGLTGTGKQTKVLDATGLKRAPLTQLKRGGEIDTRLAGKLLAAMRANSKPVKPRRLGAIGRENLKLKFLAEGCQPESFTYKRRFGATDDGLPYVLETAFGYRPGARSRRFVTGVNWSPGILNPFRELGEFGQSLDGILEQYRTGRDEPVMLLVHVACPKVEYTDRGKSAVVVGGRDDRVGDDDEEEGIDGDDELTEEDG
jgi:DNA topoisomerase VI subunit B